MNKLISPGGSGKQNIAVVTLMAYNGSDLRREENLDPYMAAKNGPQGKQGFVI